MLEGPATWQTLTLPPPDLTVRLYLLVGGLRHHSFHTTNQLMPLLQFLNISQFFPTGNVIPILHTIRVSDSEPASMGIATSQLLHLKNIPFFAATNPISEFLNPHIPSFNCLV